jgi:hypothetical protein
MRKTFHLPVPDSLGVDFHAPQQTSCYLKTETVEARWQKRDRRGAELILDVGLRSYIRQASRGASRIGAEG